MHLSNEYIDRTNSHINTIAIMIPILILCNFVQPNHTQEVFSNVSCILYFTTLFLVMAFKIFMVSLNKYNFNKYIDTEDTIDWAIGIINSISLLGIVYMVLNFIIQTFYYSFIITYVVLFVIICGFCQQLRKFKLSPILHV